MLFVNDDDDDDDATTCAFLKVSSGVAKLMEQP